MERWWQRRIGPYGVFLTLLVVLALVVVAAFVFWRSRPQIDQRTGLTPFPPSQAEYYVIDGVAGHLHRPDTVRTMTWPEHELGEVVLRTNNLGFRRDTATDLVKEPGIVRILITGDSHTDGVAFNSESVAARLENLLEDAHPGGTYEVLNGGTGHYGPQNYLGFLQRFINLDLDHFIMVIFTGNDFLDAVAGAWARGQIHIPERPATYMERLATANEIAAAAVSQGFNQLLFFRTFPDLVDPAVEITVDACERANALCSEMGIGFTVVLLPSLHDVEPERADDTFSRIAASLELDPGDALNRQLAGNLAHDLRSQGIAVIEPLDQMVRSNDALFWLLDHHLAVRGHAELASAIFDEREVQLSAGTSAGTVSKMERE